MQHRTERIRLDIGQHDELEIRRRLVVVQLVHAGSVGEKRILAFSIYPLVFRRESRRWVGGYERAGELLDHVPQ